MNLILFNSIWVKKESRAEKRRRHKYQLVNMDHGTVYFYSINTGTHYQYSEKNFLETYERVV